MIKLIIDKNIPISEESFEGQNIDFDFLPFDKINASTVKHADALFIRTATKVTKELISKSNIFLTNLVCFLICRALKLASKRRK